MSSQLHKQKPLGVHLVEASLITPTQVATALDDQKVDGRRLGEILASQMWVKQQTIEYFMEKVVEPERREVEKKSHLDDNDSQNLTQAEQACQAELEESDSLMLCAVPSCDLDVYLSPRRTVRLLFFVVLGLTLLCTAGQFCKYFLGHPFLFGLVPVFDLKLEANIPTWYSSFALLLCSLLLAVIASAKKIEGNSYAPHWVVLAFIFLFLSLDETASIHEGLNLLRSQLKVSGFLFYFWVIPYAAFVLIFVLAYLRFLGALPAKTRLLFFLAGSVYVAGAIGMEIMEARYASFYGENMLYNSNSSQSMMYEIMTIVEEFLEMLGVLVFIYALLSYISSYMKGGLRFEIVDYRKQRRRVVLPRH